MRQTKNTSRHTVELCDCNMLGPTTQHRMGGGKAAPRRPIFLPQQAEAPKRATGAGSASQVRRCGRTLPPNYGTRSQPTRKATASQANAKAGPIKLCPDMQSHIAAVYWCLCWPYGQATKGINPAGLLASNVCSVGNAQTSTHTLILSFLFSSPLRRTMAAWQSTV